MSVAKPPGASELEILNEPDWTQTHSHRVGRRGRDARLMGLTHGGDERPPEPTDVKSEKISELRQKAERGELITVRDVMTRQKVREHMSYTSTYASGVKWVPTDT
jgi:nitrate reductase (NAD(P)H)